jgi:hypothetical protein
LNDPGRLAEDAVRALCWGATPASQALITHAVTAELGAVLEQTVRSKTICLLAAYLHNQPVPGLDRTVTRFFDSTLRTNQHKTSLCRRAVLAATAALRNAGVSVAVLGGLSVEHALYRGSGARQFSDIDLLVAPADTARAQAALRERGYQPGPNAGTWTRRTSDPILPLIVLDLDPTLSHSRAADVSGLLARRAEVTIPLHDEPLPVLAPADALDHTLARLAAGAARPRWALAADAIRHSRVTAPRSPDHADTLDGWAVLRSQWPLLPTTPARLPTTGEETNR